MAYLSSHPSMQYLKSAGSIPSKLSLGRPHLFPPSRYCLCSVLLIISHHCHWQRPLQLLLQTPTLPEPCIPSALITALSSSTAVIHGALHLSSTASTTQSVKYQLLCRLWQWRRKNAFLLISELREYTSSVACPQASYSISPYPPVLIILFLTAHPLFCLHSLWHKA